VGDREIVETYLNSVPKNTTEADIFPHGTKSLLTSVIIRNFVTIVQVSLKSGKNNGYFTWKPIYVFEYISFHVSEKEKYF